MEKTLPIRCLVASLGTLIVSACAGPVHVTDIAQHQPTMASTYAFTPLTPNGADDEVKARELVAAQLAARGFHVSSTPDYVVDVAISAHPGKVGLYTTAVPHQDVPTHRYFFGECDDHAMRLAVILTDRRTGQIVSGERGGQLHCDGGASQSLPKLAAIAVAAALR